MPLQSVPNWNPTMPQTIKYAAATFTIAALTAFLLSQTNLGRDLKQWFGRQVGTSSLIEDSATGETTRATKNSKTSTEQSSASSRGQQPLLAIVDKAAFAAGVANQITPSTSSLKNQNIEKSTHGETAQKLPSAQAKTVNNSSASDTLKATTDNTELSQSKVAQAQKAKKDIQSNVGDQASNMQQTSNKNTPSSRRHISANSQSPAQAPKQNPATKAAIGEHAQNNAEKDMNKQRPSSSHREDTANPPTNKTPPSTTTGEPAEESSIKKSDQQPTKDTAIKPYNKTETSNRSGNLSPKAPPVENPEVKQPPKKTAPIKTQKADANAKTSGQDTKAKTEITATAKAKPAKLKPALTCPEQIADDLNTSYKLAKKIKSSRNRDRALYKLVTDALCKKDYDLAKKAANKIYYPTSKDSAYVKIIRVMIDAKIYDKAKSLTNRIYRSQTKKWAKKHVEQANSQ